MNKELTEKEKENIRKLCFTDPAKACAYAQEIIYTCQLVSCSTYAGIIGKAIRTVQYQVDKLTGIELPDRKYVSINQ